MDMSKKLKKTMQLIEQVEALCAVYVGRKAEGEQWGQTVARIEKLSKAVKSAKKELEQAP
jgi:hypothetical protein